MEDRQPISSEASLGREIFGPLGGIVELDAVASSGAQQRLQDVSVGDFVERHRSELDRILTAVRDIGDFHAETMAIVEELGWHREHEITAPSLLLWSGCIEAYSPSLDEPSAVQRMVDMGADLQLTNLMHALVGTASSRARNAEPTSELIVEVMSIAGALVGIRHERAVWDLFRMWRVAFLPHVLTPSSRSPEPTKANFRTYTQILAEILDPVEGA
ncbi:hypothetical protein ACFO9E_14845 [Streptomyces maoxianensis]|uniref:Uncharacterized protein n=1 Tax=Streptomyces maoxianensis TaxID=1459942 RepID=A0ABV9G810_9ACTN